MWNLKFELLQKALDLTKYVIVERQHIPKNGGKPYWEKHHVLPNEVKATDKVIGNHHNLPKSHPQKHQPAPAVATPAPPAWKQHHLKIADDAKAKANAWQQKQNFKDNTELLAAIKKLGVVWKENANPGINLMFAKRELAKAISNGFDPDSPTPMPVPVAPTPAPQPVKLPANTSTQVKVSAQSKNITNEFYSKDCNGDRDVFYKKLKDMGITWNENNNPGINLMWAKRSLSLAIENGFDPKNPTTDKPSTQIAFNTAPKDPSALEVPDNATEREKNLIKHINKMTELSEIQDCALMGMVPEDNRAKQFILDKLQVKLATAVLNPNNEPWFMEKDAKGNKKFPKELRDKVKSLWGVTKLKELISGSKSKGYSKNPEGFGMAVAEQLDLLGCKKHATSRGFEQMARFNMGWIVNPRDNITAITPDPRRALVDVRTCDIIQSLNEAYADYTTDQYQGKYQSNLGYNGYDSTEYDKRYDVNKEGFVRCIRKIAENNPALQPKVDELVKTYDEMMQTVKGNPHTLNAILQTYIWDNNQPEGYSVQTFGTHPTSRGQASHLVQDADKLSDLVIGELNKRGYSQDAILSALKDVEINDGLNSFEIKNSNGNTDVIDFTQLTDNNGLLVLNLQTNEDYWGENLLHYTRAKFQQSQNLPLDDKANEAIGMYNAAKQLSEVSTDDYKKVHQLSMKLFGLKLNHFSGGEFDYSKADATQDWMDFADQAVEDDSPEMGLLLTNLRMHKMFHDVNTEIVREIGRNAASQFNDGGKNYAGNFDYYSGTMMSRQPQDSPRFTQLENKPDGAKYTAKQLSDKISQQLNQVPNYSIDYVKKLQDYYSNSGRQPKVDGMIRHWGEGTDAYLDNPVKDILYQVANNVSQHVPATATKPTFKKLTAKRLSYAPFDFSAKVQPRPNKPKPSAVPPPPDPQVVKSAREALLKAAKCSLATESEENCKKMREKYTGEYWDYKPGEVTKDGTKMPNAVHSLPPNVNTPAVGNTYNTIPLFNSPFFKINNSLQHDNFVAKQEELKAAGKSAMCWTSERAFQGTSYWSSASILGQDGAFFMGDEVNKTGKMLGNGAYFGWKLGKTAPYSGNASYACRPGNKVSSLTSSKDESNGVSLIVDIMRGGRPSTMGKAAARNKFLTSLSIDANPDYDKDGVGVRDGEIAVKDNALIDPQYMVDVSMRTIGFNIRRCPEGYRDVATGKLLYDSTGCSVDMLYND